MIFKDYTFMKNTDLYIKHPTSEMLDYDNEKIGIGK